MTEHCVDLDAFFDGELATDQADAFRDHLATCDRCQSVLGGRIHEDLIVSLGQARVEESVEPAEQPVQPLVPETSAAKAAPDKRQRFRRWWATIASGVAGTAVAAGVFGVLYYRQPAPQYVAERVAPGTATANSLALALLIDSGPLKMRGFSPHVGDTLYPRAHGDTYQALWVFLDGRELVTSCPGDRTCKSSNGDLSLSLELKLRGKYTIVALGSASPFHVSAGTYDTMMAEVTKLDTNVQVQVQHLNVD